jgi:dihydroorotate dehydrogenase electron transfer subunit
MGTNAAVVPVDIEARVISNTRLSSDYNVVALEAPQIAAAVAPGQFVMVKPGRSHDPLLRRPFSVFEILEKNGRAIGVSLLSKRVGITTSLLYDAVGGDVISCLGPLGRPFTMLERPRQAWMVAGGVGLAPFATLASAMLARGVRVTLFYGARSSRELFYLDWFQTRGVVLELSTDDGSKGVRGRVTVPLDRALTSRGDENVRVYACGPEPMLEAVAEVCARHNRPCEVSVERVMGCGMGGCYSCVVSVRNAEGGHNYVRSCIGGPVFSAADLVWD